MLLWRVQSEIDWSAAIPQATVPVGVIMVFGIAGQWHEGLSYPIALPFSEAHNLRFAHAHPRYRRALSSAPKGGDERQEVRVDFQQYARAG